MHQECSKLPRPQRFLDLLVSLKLMRIQRSWRTFRRKNSRWRFRLELDQFPARERPCCLARARHGSLQLREIVRAWMQLQKRVQLALPFGELHSIGIGREPRSAQSRPEDSQRGALRLYGVRRDYAI